MPTAHHQAIDRLGDGLIATAWAADGIIEAVELARRSAADPFVLAVQWHPEAGTDPRLFRALVARGRGTRLIAGRSAAARPAPQARASRLACVSNAPAVEIHRSGQAVRADHRGGRALAARPAGAR